MADMNEKLAAAGKTFADVASTKKPAPAVQEGTLVRETGTPDMPVEEIETRELLDAVTRIRHEEWRLIQICASKVAEDSYEILYTFGRAYDIRNLRLCVHGNDRVSSITSIYEVAYLYENEIHDLYGIEIDMMNYDFNGKLFRTVIPTPFR
ncbi:MAG: NADH-quinone oxidoreductase subunit C [Bacillota bacterium]|nr:NADH-quinone oxidoreductase subunit C [Bacillota bacterium]